MRRAGHVATEPEYHIPEEHPSCEGGNTEESGCSPLMQSGPRTDIHTTPTTGSPSTDDASATNKGPSPRREGLHPCSVVLVHEWLSGTARICFAPNYQSACQHGQPKRSQTPTPMPIYVRHHCSVVRLNHHMMPF